jgi:hypothetical protein
VCVGFLSFFDAHESMKKPTSIELIIIFGLAFMLVVSFFRASPPTSAQFQKGLEPARPVTLPDTRRMSVTPTARPLGTGLSGFEGWYEQLPDWLASNSFPTYVLPETRSLAVSLRAMYAETNATPRALKAGYDLVGNNLIWGPQSNIFCRTLSQRFLLENEVSGRLFFELSNKVREFNE